MDATDQVMIDNIMIDLDGTPNKARLGANAILAVSLAVAKAAADRPGLPLYRYVGGAYARTLPVPMMNILNGGKHADNPIDIQEFMILPVGAGTVADAVRMGSEIFQTLKKGLHDAGHNTNVGDEGGFAPNLKSADEALSFIAKAVEKAGYRPGEDIIFALDPASTRVLQGRQISPRRRGQGARWRGHGPLLRRSGRRFPIVSIEDGCAEDDWETWKLTDRPLGGKTATRRRRYFRDQPGAPAPRHRARSANAILIKVNQIGTLSRRWRRWKSPIAPAGRTVMSHRSGETEDATIADLAVATNGGQIKTGSLARSDRTAKYNQLIRIEEQLGDAARYAGSTILRR